MSMSRKNRNVRQKTEEEEEDEEIVNNKKINFQEGSVILIKSIGPLLINNTNKLA